MLDMNVRCGKRGPPSCLYYISSGCIHPAALYWTVQKSKLTISVDIIPKHPVAQLCAEDYLFVIYFLVIVTKELSSPQMAF